MDINNTTKTPKNHLRRTSSVKKVAIDKILEQETLKGSTAEQEVDVAISSLSVHETALNV